MSSIVRILVIVLSFPFLAEAQSLGSVAKKEKERREKNKAEGVAVREIAEDEIKSDEDEEPADADAENAEGGIDSEVTPLPFPAKVELNGPKTKSLDDEKLDRQKREAQWKARAQQARDRVESARERVQSLEGLHLMEGERYVDSEGRTVISSLDELKRIVAEANADLQSAEQALRQLQEEARRSGVPPGWLR